MSGFGCCSVTGSKIEGSTPTLNAVTGITNVVVVRDVEEYKLFRVSTHGNRSDIQLRNDTLPLIAVAVSGD
jgi:hypothetical protein